MSMQSRRDHQISSSRSKLRQDVDIREVARSPRFGDGIAHVYGLDRVMSNELLEFPGRLRAGLNLEEENVGVVLLGESHLVAKGTSSEDRRIMPVRRPAMIGRVVNPLGSPSTARARSSRHLHVRRALAPASSTASPSRAPAAGTRPSTR